MAHIVLEDCVCRGINGLLRSPHQRAVVRAPLCTLCSHGAIHAAPPICVPLKELDYIGKRGHSTLPNGLGVVGSKALRLSWPSLLATRANGSKVRRLINLCAVLKLRILEQNLVLCGDLVAFLTSRTPLQSGFTD